MPISICCVKDCFMRSREVKLFNFPASESLREVWLRYVRPFAPELENLTAKQILSKKICIKHFEKKYVIKGKRSFNACPTLMTPEEIASGRPSRELHVPPATSSCNWSEFFQDCTLGMDIEEEEIATYCSTCLSIGRNLAELPQKYRKLLSVLLPSIDVNEDLKMCWECLRCVHRIDLFHNRALLANKTFHIFLKNQASVTALESQSTLGFSNMVLASIEPECNTDIHTTNEDVDGGLRGNSNNNDCLNTQREDIAGSKVEFIDVELKSDVGSEFVKSNESGNTEKVTGDNEQKLFNKLCAKKTKSKKVKLKGRKPILDYKCKICDKSFHTRGSYYYHKESHNAKPRCDKCGKTFVSKSVLWTHNNLVHKNVEQYCCQVCNKICFTKTGYKEHVANHDITDEKNILFCKPCSKFFKTNSGLRRHQRLSIKHHDPTLRRFQCSQCDRRFVSETRARQHRDTVHLKVNKVTCHLCSKQYCTLGGLKAHIKIIHEGVPMPRNNVCDICGKTFKRPQVLKSHQATHTGDRPHACPHCAMRFTQSSSLRTHIARLHPANK